MYALQLCNRMLTSSHGSITATGIIYSRRIWSYGSTFMCVCVCVCVYIYIYIQSISFLHCGLQPSSNTNSSYSSIALVRMHAQSSEASKASPDATQLNRFAELSRFGRCDRAFTASRSRLLRVCEHKNKQASKQTDTCFQFGPYCSCPCCR